VITLNGPVSSDRFTETIGNIVRTLYHNQSGSGKSKMAATKHKIRVSACAHVRNKILATRAPGSGDWLHTLPLSSIGLKMDNATVRIAVSLRLGAPIVRPHLCVCGTEVAVNGYRHGSGRHSRRNQVNEILCRAFNATGAYAIREPHSLCGRNDKRPDGATQIPWIRGRCLAWDATCPNTYAQS